MNKVKVKTIAQELQLLNAPITDVMFHGLSMEPLLQEGDRVVIEEIGFADINIGDIITYRYQDKYPTRRVVIKREEDLVLWCDNWPDRRFQAQNNDVLGRVVSRNRAGSVLLNTDKEWTQLSHQAMHRFRGVQFRHRLNFLRRVWTRMLSFLPAKNNRHEEN